MSASSRRSRTISPEMAWEALSTEPRSSAAPAGAAASRARRAAEDLAGDEVGVRALEAPHRLGRAPAAVGPVRLGQVGAGDGGLAERAEGEARELVGERLVVEVAAALREGDRLVVAIPRGARVAADALELGVEQGAAVRQVLRAEVRPAREFFSEELRAGEEERALVRGDHVRRLRERDAGVEMERGGAVPGRHGRDLDVQRERGARRFLERALEDAEEHDVEVGEEERALVVDPAGLLDHLVDVDPRALELGRVRGLDRELVRELSDRADHPGDGVALVELAYRLVALRLGEEVGEREAAQEAVRDGVDRAVERPDVLARLEPGVHPREQRLLAGGVALSPVLHAGAPHVAEHRFGLLVRVALREVDGGAAEAVAELDVAAAAEEHPEVDAADRSRASTARGAACSRGSSRP